jgi:hypothetical protein
VRSRLNAAPSYFFSGLIADIRVGITLGDTEDGASNFFRARSLFQVQQRFVAAPELVDLSRTSRSGRTISGPPITPRRRIATVRFWNFDRE